MASLLRPKSDKTKKKQREKLKKKELCIGEQKRGNMIEWLERLTSYLNVSFFIQKNTVGGDQTNVDAYSKNHFETHRLI